MSALGRYRARRAVPDAANRLRQFGSGGGCVRNVRIALRHPSQPGSWLAAGSHQLRRSLRDFAASGQRQAWPASCTDGRRDPGAPKDPWDAKTSDLDPANDAALQSVADPDPNNADTSPDGSAKADAKNTQQLPPGSNPLDSGEKGDPAHPSDANANPSPGADSKSGQQNGSKDAEGRQGLEPIRQFRRQFQPGKQAARCAVQSAGEDEAAIQDKAAGSRTIFAIGELASLAARREAGRRSEIPGQEQADASANSQSEGDQQQGGTQQASQGKSEGRSNNQPNSPDGKSGIGKQDGDKAAREAAELAAMGKLSEIIGKRAANISGEVMVEVSSGQAAVEDPIFAAERHARRKRAGKSIAMKFRWRISSTCSSISRRCASCRRGRAKPRRMQSLQRRRNRRPRRRRRACRKLQQSAFCRRSCPGLSPTTSGSRPNFVGGNRIASSGL